MITVSSSVAGSPEGLWSLVGDVEGWGELLPTVTSVRRVDDDGAIGVGSRFEVRQPGLPKAVYEVTGWEPGRAFTWVARSLGVATTASHEVVPEGDGARLDLTLRWSGPLAGLIRLLVGAKARGMVKSEAATFTRLAGDG